MSTKTLGPCPLHSWLLICRALEVHVGLISPGGGGRREEKRAKEGGSRLTCCMPHTDEQRQPVGLPSLRGQGGAEVGHGASTGCLLEGEEVLNLRLEPHAKEGKRVKAGSQVSITELCAHPLLLSLFRSSLILCLTPPLPPNSPCNWDLENTRISDTKNGFP